MNTKLVKAFVSVLLALAAGIAAQAQSTYFNAITNLNAAGYWPMHEVAAPAPGDIETNYGSLGPLANGYYPDYQVNVGAFTRQMQGALANDSDPAVYFIGPSNGGTTTNGLTVPHASPLATLRPPFSVEFWMLATNIGSGQGDIVSQARGDKTCGVRVYYQNNNIGAVVALVYNGTASGTLTFTASSATNQWHHLVLTCAANTNMSVYFDGVQGGTGGSASAVAEVGKFAPDWATPFVVGTGLGYARAFNGLVDEVAVYTNVITDISQHYSDGLYGGSGAYFSDVTNDKPVIYLRMDSMPYTAPDISTWPALVNDGQTNGVALGNGVYTPGTVPGLVAGAAYAGFPLGVSGANVALLSGVSSFADAGYAPAYNPTGTTPFTVSAFFRGNPTDTNRVQSIVGHGTNSWELGLTTAGKLVFNSGTNSAAVVATGSGAGDLVGTGFLNDAAWHHVVAVHNNTTNVLYVDGVPNATNVVAANNVGNSYDVMIGSDPCYTNTPIGFGRQFAGQICDAAFFTNALSATDVQNLYNQAAVLPAITQQPASAIINAGTAFTNTVVTSGGSAPVYYQWYFNSVSSYSGATAMADTARVFGTATTKLADTSAQAGDAGYYFVLVTNHYGALTSTIARLTVYSTPLVMGQFPIANTSPITLYGGTSPTTVGSSPTFSISVVGPQLAYQWLTNGVAATGATNASFTLTNCQMTSPTSFKCVVNNSYGSATSMVWTVSYIPAPTAPFAQAVLMAQPITYWRLNEPDDGQNDGNPGAICRDLQSGNNGIYTNVYLANSQSGTGYSTTTDPTETAAQFGNYTGYGCFADWIGTNIDFSVPAGNNAQFSVAVWANGNNTVQVGNAGLVTKGNFNGEEFTLDEGSGAIAQGLRFSVRNAAGTAFNANSYVQLASDSMWHFVVGVCDQANSSVALWVDGIRVTNITMAAGSGIINSGGIPLMIGARSSNPTPPGNNQFRGFLNEVALYNYALASTQIVHQFQVTGIAPYITQQPIASTNFDDGGVLVLSVVASGSPPLAYRWYDNNAQHYISGQTNATLVLSNLTASDSYYVTVSNLYGTVTSDTAAANDVPGAPVIYTDVLNPFSGIGGASAANSVEAHGTAPLAYQWQFLSGATWVNLADNYRISGSHSRALTIGRVRASDQGNYQVIITNTLGSVTSSVAALVVAALPLNFNGDGLDWKPNGSARIGNNLLSLTDPNNGGGTASFFFQVPQYIAAFQASFTYQAQSAGNGLADGMTFCLQNDPRGPAAIGSGGGGLGVGNGSVITPSAELMLDIYGGSGFAFGTNGVNIPNNGAASANFRPTGSVLLNSGDPVDITVTYANGQMALTFADALASTSFTTSLAVPDLTQILGASTAYVGFTAGYGGQTSVQTITNFSFVSVATLGFQVSNGTNAVLTWPGGLVGYDLQQNADLTTTNWLTVTNSDAAVSGQHRVVLPLRNTNQFFRLKLAQ
jgi:prepilin-type processing-associated H-X9-DG protein